MKLMIMAGLIVAMGLVVYFMYVNRDIDPRKAMRLAGM